MNAGHIAGAFRDSPVMHEISRSDLFPRRLKRRILPIMSMLIGPPPPPPLLRKKFRRVGRTPGSILDRRDPYKWSGFPPAPTAIFNQNNNSITEARVAVATQAQSVLLVALPTRGQSA